ncbi:uncharacterized protein LOC112546746 isoform X4 [Pelodiscus sinensis]|uniref:uncharacterized protein LOC112546746 isoform X4 n=1 Tax=Pelodiscus sinensis TaxID=13735 RepID=UPI003F6B4C13
MVLANCLSTADSLSTLKPPLQAQLLSPLLRAGITEAVSGDWQQEPIHNQASTSTRQRTCGAGTSIRRGGSWPTATQSGWESSPHYRWSWPTASAPPAASGTNPPDPSPPESRSPDKGVGKSLSPAADLTVSAPLSCQHLEASPAGPAPEPPAEGGNNRGSVWGLAAGAHPHAGTSPPSPPLPARSRSSLWWPGSPNPDPPSDPGLPLALQELSRALPDVLHALLSNLLIQSPDTARLQLILGGEPRGGDGAIVPASPGAERGAVSVAGGRHSLRGAPGSAQNRRLPTGPDLPLSPTAPEHVAGVPPAPGASQGPWQHRGPVASRHHPPGV